MGRQSYYIRKEKPSCTDEGKKSENKWKKLKKGVDKSLKG